MIPINTTTPLKRVGGFKALGLTNPIQALMPYLTSTQNSDQPLRKSLRAPQDNFTFVKPIKQSFVKNPRLMPMTRLMLTLLAGWGGQGGPIKTTIGSIAKHLNRSRRQVFRYLKDALEEGYLSYSKTVGRDGLYTGIKIWLNRSAIQHHSKPRKSDQKPTNPDVTDKSDINQNLHINTKQNDEFMKTLLQFGETFGYFERKEHRKE